MRPGCKEDRSPDFKNTPVVLRRGRPRKADRANDEGRSYWFGEVFFDQGWAWGTELVEMDSTEGMRRWQAFPICLGREETILPVVRGEKAIPDDMHERRKAVLKSILEVNDNGRVNSRATGLQRGGNTRAIRYRQKDTRRLKARERLSLRKAHYKVKSISSG